MERSRDKLYRTEAVVLRRVDVGEADRVLTIYTPLHGKLRVIAKGVRRPTSHLGGHLELFTRSKLMLAKGREFDYVTQAETLDPFIAFRADASMIWYPYYAAELLDRLSPDAFAVPPAYQLLLDMLGWLARTHDRDTLLRWYEVQLLGHLGYKPELSNCLICKSLLEPLEGNAFSVQGGIICPTCAPQQRATNLSLATFKLLRLMQRSPDYAAINSVRVSEAVANEVKLLLSSYIQYITERELRSARYLAPGQAAAVPTSS